MKERAILFELSGEHPSLPLAELEACVEALAPGRRGMARGPGFAVFRLGEETEKVAGRLALTHRAGEYLGSCAPEDLRAFAPRLELPPGSVAVRVKRFGGRGTPDQATAVMRVAGEALRGSRRIDLTRPDVRLRVLLDDRLTFFLDEIRVDREQYERRHVRSRPFFSPVSLHPRYARALVNLTQVLEGQTLLDPFCGTGGLLLEAALMGVRALGSDASPEMIEGCRENMAHFGARWQRLEVLDIGEVAEAFGAVEAVATDPPYGRSASTRREPVRELHERGLRAVQDVLKPSRLAGVVLPYPCGGTEGLRLEQEHVQRVHRSLDRHYCLLRRPGR